MVDSEIVQVEIMNAWWDQILPIMAIVISVATLIWTIWVRKRDFARPTVSAQWSLPIGAIEYPETLDLEVSNGGRVGNVVVEHIYLDAGKSGALHPEALVFPAPNLPKTLSPGERVNLHADPVKIARACAAHGISPTALRPAAQTGHGKYTGKMKTNGLSLIQRCLSQ